MGNLCGKEEADPFSTPGRRLDSATPPAVTTGPITSQPKRQVGGPTRTLGGGQVEAGNWGANADEARMKAAAAAEVGSGLSEYVVLRLLSNGKRPVADIARL